jgi:hypothetical protein
MTPLEVAWGWVPGFDNEAATWADTGPVQSPVAVLESLLLRALQARPCVIEFSGGRDSSALLALATDLARREGMELPLPLTRRYPDVPETDESDWQELVIKHIGLTEWERFEIGDELDLLGPVAAKSLRMHGLLWPPTTHIKGPVWEIAVGGCLVSGEGGDEVLGRRRVTPVAGLLAGNLHPRRTAIKLTVEALAPRTVRRRFVHSNRPGHERPWLTQVAQQLFLEALADDIVDEPLRWDRSIERHLRRRTNREGSRTLKLAAAAHGVDYLSPFLDERFVHALAREGGLLGYPGRPAAMRALFGHLLPDEVLSRRDKAEFTRAVFRRYSRSFVDGWQGGGVDVRFVDPAVLRQTWKADSPHAGTFTLLHSIWLSAEGIEPPT